MIDKKNILIENKIIKMSLVVKIIYSDNYMVCFEEEGGRGEGHVEHGAEKGGEGFSSTGAQGNSEVVGWWREVVLSGSSWIRSFQHLEFIILTFGIDFTFFLIFRIDFTFSS